MDKLVLSGTILLMALAPSYDWLDTAVRTPAIFSIVGCLLLILIGRYSQTTILVVLGLLLYTSLIVLFNGVESVRLGVVSTIFLGLLFSTTRVYLPFLWASVASIAYFLYVHTDGFAAIVWEPLTESMGHNYFGEVLGFVLIAALMSGKRAPLLVLAIFGVGALTAIFIPSRQLLVVVGTAGLFLIMMTRRAALILFLLCAVAGIAAYQYGESIAAIDKLIGAQFASPRGDIFRCYMENLSVTDILIGSDHTVSGACGLAVVGVTYLHSGYLETVNQMGLLGVLVILAYPFALFYSLYRRDFRVFLTLALAGTYLFVESASYMWIFFMIIFRGIEELHKSRIGRSSRSGVPIPPAVPGGARS